MARAMDSILVVRDWLIGQGLKQSTANAFCGALDMAARRNGYDVTRGAITCENKAGSRCIRVIASFPDGHKFKAAYVWRAA